MNIKRNHYKNAVIAFQKIFSPIVLHMIHYIFAFLSHNLGPNSQSGDKHPVIELSILELSTGFYYKIYTRISLLNVTSRLPIFEKFHPAHWPKDVREQYWRRCDSNSRNFRETEEGRKQNYVCSTTWAILPSYRRNQNYSNMIFELQFANNQRFLPRGKEKTCSTAKKSFKKDLFGAIRNVALIQHDSIMY